MERIAFFPGIRIEKDRRFCGFDLYMDQGCLAVRAEAEKEKEIFRRINLLQAGLVLYAYTKKEDELLKACGHRVVYENPRAASDACLFEAWDSVEWIFENENQISVFWFASYLTGKEARTRFLSLYYALKTITDKQKDLSSVLSEYAGGEVTREFLETVKRLRVDREDIEERGIEMPEIACDENLTDRMAEVWNRLFEDAK